MRTDGQTDVDKLRARDGEIQEVSGPGEFEVRGRREKLRVWSLRDGEAGPLMPEPQLAPTAATINQPEPTRS